MNVGELQRFLQAHQPDTPIIVYINLGSLGVTVTDLGVTSAQGDGNSGVEVQLFWRPQEDLPLVGP
jgi:hypothetical protein